MRLRPVPVPAFLGLLCAASSTLAAQEPFTLLEGSPQGPVDVLVRDASRPGAPPRTIKTRVRITPIETTNRTVQYALHDGQARRVTRGGLSYLELPGRRRLLCFVDDAAGTRGYLLVLGDGDAKVLLERRRSAPNGPDDEPIAVSPGGEFAVAVTNSKGLVALRLDGLDFAASGSPARDLSLQRKVEPESVLVGARCVFFQTDDHRLWRGSLVEPTPPEDVTPSLPPDAELEEKMAISGDGRVLAFLAGQDHRTLPWLLFEQGGPVAVETRERDYLEPEYLPDDTDGPWLMLDRDGSRLLFVEKGMANEFYLVDTARPAEPLHITNDVLFHTCVGIGILPAFAGDTLLVALGHVDEHDWYAVRTSEPTVRNITRTTPIQHPWYPGRLAPRAAHVLGSKRTLVVEQRDGVRRPYLRVLDADRATSRVLVEDLSGPIALGESLAGSPDVTVHAAGGDVVLSSAANVVLRTPPGLRLSRTIVGPNRSFRALRVTLPAGGEIAAFVLADGSLLTWPSAGLRQVVLTSHGLLLNGATLDYFAPGRRVRLQSGGPWRWVISGAGT